MSILSEDLIKIKLQELEYWDYIDGALHTSLDFKSFRDAFAMMTRIAFEAEAQNHHPDWSNVYNNLSIKLFTHDAGGVTEKDIKMATSIENIIKGE
ncbi:4a-hydroxytetrahydrobiopterin dehydratase [Zhouia amylolytica]|uniref:Putative pterin-4-alpha-carbinolamine dehydratase n=2 Tax=Zhouia amylolytica TaxID=376730 RepID=W2UQI9_9FLAO|nr:4a-hydroxytetrahydrobiopterin dehydratase [Zhouia amylolytica]ETN96420.1 pterin-4a-carbinolamine dehydratase [Zhouia amylolytica AD3]MCQ0112669.1 4a-hydroxytetrahydrobiopterin dehydratase [Zhouia amylolytica]SFS83095.1 4a-hydroxytetrahydrobiopterin dehydratase [Zhouia amylolytica]